MYNHFMSHLGPRRIRPRKETIHGRKYPLRWARCLSEQMGIGMLTLADSLPGGNRATSPIDAVSKPRDRPPRGSVFVFQ